MKVIPMSGARFNSVSDLVTAVGGEQLANEVESRIASRGVVSKLVALRCAKDMSQGDIALALGCSQSRVSKLENGLDEDLRLGDIAKYAQAVGRHIHIMFPERKTLFEVVKYHAFQIARCLKQVTKMSVGDEEMERGAVHAHLETLANTTSLIAQSAAQIPCLRVELVRIMSECETSDDETDADEPYFGIVSDDSHFDAMATSC